MKLKYCVNNDTTHNPGYHHEVHTLKHAEELKISNKIILGSFDNCAEALKEARKLYANADGCKICCYECHTG